MIDNPYITKRELAEAIGIREISIWRNIETMRGKYLRRVGSNKSGFWEMIVDDRTEKVTIKVTKNRTEKEVSLTEVRAAILRLIKDDPYISKAELAKEIVYPSLKRGSLHADLLLNLNSFCCKTLFYYSI